MGSRPPTHQSFGLHRAGCSGDGLARQGQHLRCTGAAVVAEGTVSAGRAVSSSGCSEAPASSIACSNSDSRCHPRLHPPPHPKQTGEPNPTRAVDADPPTLPMRASPGWLRCTPSTSLNPTLPHPTRNPLKQPQRPKTHPGDASRRVAALLSPHPTPTPPYPTHPGNASFRVGCTAFQC